MTHYLSTNLDFVQLKRASKLTTNPNDEIDLGFLSPAEQDDEIGRLGGYRVLEVLGVGAMGIVFRAEDPRLSRFIALKVMKFVGPENPRARQRFLREAQSAGCLEHDNVVTIYQVGEDGEIPYIAMQLLEGESLQDVLDRDGQLSQARVCEIGQQIAQGLSAAHQQGLIHRDVKPDNIWIEADGGRVKILDFGIARSVQNDVEMTTSGMVMGSPRYMSPEQATSEPVDHRSDLFSLGSVLYHLVSGKPPFDGKNVTATLMAVSLAEEPPIVDQVPGIEPKLAAVIHQLLQRDPDNRPQSARDVADALGAIEQERLADPVLSSRNAHLGSGGRWRVYAMVGFVAVIALGSFLFWRPNPLTDLDPLSGLQEVLITPVSVRSSTHDSDLYPDSQLIDGSGFAGLLTLGNFESMEHAGALPNNVWVTIDPGGWRSDYFQTGPAPELTFDLDGNKQVTSVAIWGYFIQGAFCNNEAKTMEFRFSSDGGATYHTEVKVGHQLTGTRVEKIDLRGPHLADTIQVRIVDNHFVTIKEKGGDRVGLSEIRFLGYGDGDTSERETTTKAQESTGIPVSRVDELDEHWSDPVSLAPAINFAGYNYAPWVSADELEFWFVANLGTGNGVDDLCVARRESPADEWQPAEPIGPPINTDAHETAFTLSNDRQEIFFVRSGTLLRSSRTDAMAAWSDPTPVAALNGTIVQSTALSHDGLKLYCSVSLRERVDIYECTRIARGEPWSDPVEPPGELNSDQMDWPCSISTDHCRMLIESTRLESQGNRDLWVATRPSIDAPWEKPRHMKAPINSDRKDTTGWWSADGNTLLFGSARPGGKTLMDIYMSKRGSQ